jgi:Zn-dependent protease
MHEQRPSETEGEYLPPPDAPPPKQGKGNPTGWRAVAGGIGGLTWAAIKFKSALSLLLGFKFLVLLPKFFGLFISLALYAWIFGWKFGIVFVLLILVHELGHYMTFRNFGIKADLPFFIPGIGAYVSSRGPVKSLTVEAIVALAGPIYGVLASGMCFWLSVTTHDPFWTACAYMGFFLNAINLLPVPPLDGGGIAAAIDPRLWIGGAFAFLGFIVYFHYWVGLIFVVLIGMSAYPRIKALLAGYVDPRFYAVKLSSRIMIAVAYFVTAAIAAAGAYATYFDPRAHV